MVDMEILQEYLEPLEDQVVEVVSHNVMLADHQQLVVQVILLQQILLKEILEDQIQE